MLQELTIFLGHSSLHLLEEIRQKGIGHVEQGVSGSAQIRCRSPTEGRRKMVMGLQEENGSHGSKRRLWTEKNQKHQNQKQKPNDDDPGPQIDLNLDPACPNSFQGLFSQLHQKHV